MPINHSQTESGDELRLNALIEQWAVQNRLSDVEAEAIRQGIVTSSAILPFEWWWNLFKNIGLVERKDGVNSMHASFFSALSTNTSQHALFPNQRSFADESVTFVPYLQVG